MAAHAPRNQTSRDIFCMQSFIGIRRWRWPPAMTSDGRIFFGGVLISRNFETPFRFVSFFHFYLSLTNYRRTCLYLLRSLARLYNLHARFFDRIFEIKFCSFGFLSFFFFPLLSSISTTHVLGPFLKLNYWIVNPIVFERQCIHVYFRVHKIKSDKWLLPLRISNMS